MAWPAFCPDGEAYASRPIQLVEADTGLVVASLVVRAGGRVHGYRDGVATITSFVPLADRAYVLRLEGPKVEGAPPVRFSEVEVRRR